MVDTLKRKLIFEFIFIFIIIPLLVILNNEKLFVFITLLLFFFISIFLLKNTKNFSFKSFSKKTDWKYICFFSCLFIIAGFIYTIIIDKNLLFNSVGAVSNNEHIVGSCVCIVIKATISKSSYIYITVRPYG